MDFIPPYASLKHLLTLITLFVQFGDATAHFNVSFTVLASNRNCGGGLGRNSPHALEYQTIDQCAAWVAQRMYDATSPCGPNFNFSPLGRGQYVSCECKLPPTTCDCCNSHTHNCCWNEGGFTAGRIISRFPDPLKQFHIVSNNIHGWMNVGCRDVATFNAFDYTSYVSSTVGPTTLQRTGAWDYPYIYSWGGLYHRECGNSGGASFETWRRDVRTHSTDAWERLPDTNGYHPYARIRSAKFGRKVYSFSNTLCEYLNLDDVQSGWQLCRRMLTDSRDDCSTAVFQGKIWVTGGPSPTVRGDSVEIYDPLSDSWSYGPNMSASRGGHCTVVYNGFLYAIGGYGQDTVERTDGTSWELLPQRMPVRRNDGAAFVVPNGILVFGGQHDNWRRPERSTYLFDGIANWERKLDSRYIVAGVAIVGPDFSSDVFRVNPGWNSGYLDRFFNETMYIGAPYGSTALSDISFLGAQGGTDDIAFRLSFADGVQNPGFTVDTDTGRVVGLIEQGANGTYNMSLLASNRIGELAFVKSWSFDVAERPLFSTSEIWGDGSGFMATEAFDGLLLLGEAYTSTAPSGITKEEMFVDYFGEASAIAYRLRFRTVDIDGESNMGPGGFTVDSLSGRIIGIPEREGSFIMDLVAVDVQGRVASVYLWHFNVTSRPELRLMMNFTYVPDLPANVSNGTAYKFTPLSLLAGTSLDELFSGYVGDISYRLDVLSTSSVNRAAGDILLDTSTGYLQIFPSGVYSISLELIAVDTPGRAVSVATWDLEALNADIDNPFNGPNQMGCGEGTPVDDGSLYDGSFSCSCPTGFQGDNCETRNIVVCEFGDLNSDATACFVPDEDCPRGCTCNATTPEVGTVGNRITAVCSRAPEGQFPDGIRMIDLTSLNISRLSDLESMVLVPNNFAEEEGQVVVSLHKQNDTSDDGVVAGESIFRSQSKYALPECLSNTSLLHLPISACSSGTCSTPLRCEEGTYMNLEGTACDLCPRGGFYNDLSGRVGEFAHCPSACQMCTNGTYSIVVGAKSLHGCKVCPTGTETSRFAGYRACPCLSGFARTDRFGPCESCSEHEGITCYNEYKELLPGYYWRFDSLEELKVYVQFCHNLDMEHDYDKSSTILNITVPEALLCPRRESCLGGINSTCAYGYEGPLCAVCASDYAPSFGECIKCALPVVNWIAFIIFGGLLIFTLYRAWIRPVLYHPDPELTKDKDDEASGDPASETDFVMSDILIDHFVVISQSPAVFSHVVWTSATRLFLNFLKHFAEPLSSAFGLGCVTDFNAHKQMISFTVLPVLLSILVCTVGWTRGNMTKAAGILQNFMPTLVEYAINAEVSVIRPCVEISGAYYMSDDYSIACDETHDMFRTFAILCLSAYVLLMIVSLQRMWRMRNNHGEKDFVKWFHFFSGDFNDFAWYWRYADIARVVVLTTITRLFPPDVQVIFSIILSTALLVFQLTYRNQEGETTYKHRGSQTLYNMALGSVLVTYIMVAWLQLNEMHEESEREMWRASLVDFGLITAVVIPWTFALYLFFQDKVRRQSLRNSQANFFDGTYHNNPTFERAPHYDSNAEDCQSDYLDVVASI